MYILYDEESDQKSDMMAQLVAVLFYSILFYSIHGISTFCIFKLIMVFAVRELSILTLPLKGHLLWSLVINYLTMQVIWSGTNLNQPLTHLEPFLITLYD